MLQIGLLDRGAANLELVTIMLAICRGDADATPWAIMVREFMLQQTPVERVRGPWQARLERWPTPASLAAASPGEWCAWGRLGYPRRAPAAGGTHDHR